MLILHNLECSPLPLVMFSTDDFGDEVQVASVRSASVGDFVRIADDTWWHLFEIEMHIRACREVAP